MRGAVAQGLPAHCRVWWLPFVVYAAEIGYNYAGGEYWPLFAQKTPGWESSPGWNVSSNRDRIKRWFKKFSAEYGGAEPKGSFAENFNIIAWPITHAVMPAYLQRQLAQLLFESRAVLTTELLSDPRALGACLASRTVGYSERFQIFCANQSLLGQVAAALLSGDGEESPYLVHSALVRLVDDLSSERQSRTWLTRAKRSADLARSSGFRSNSSGLRATERAKRLAVITDPKLLLRRENGGWRPYMELPDLTPLQVRQKQVDQELRSLRPRVEGHRGPLPRGKLVYLDKVPLSAWPRPEVPLIQLERGSSVVNSLIAENCFISQGPWWVFRKQSGGLALEVKGKFLRPGHEYCLVGWIESDPPALPWVAKTTVLADGVHAFDLKMPQILRETDIAQLVAAGLSVVSDVSIRPAGLVPGSWDGEGAVDWLAGEPAMLAVRAARAVDKIVVTVDHGTPFVLDWPAGKSELIFALENLAVGTHEVDVSVLTPATGASLVSGSLVVTIRDPHTTLEEATKGSGIRLFAAPARPKLTELWDGLSSLSIAGPLDLTAELMIVLRDDAGKELAQHRQVISLPFSDGAWKKFAEQQLRKGKLLGSYDEAESCEVSVSRGGVGFASLICERGFHPLRWVLTKRRDGGHEARLIDRTDRDGTQVQLFPVEAPLTGEERDSRGPIAIPASGGMLQATSGNATAAIILPPDPNRLRQRPNDRPVVQCASLSLSEVQRLIHGHCRWLDANLPADPFARRQQEQALNAIATALVSLVAGSRWARLERKRVPVGNCKAPDVLDEMQELVGEAPTQRAVAQQIAGHLWQWLDSPAALSEGFANAIAPIAAANGIDDPHTAADFLLRLASRPGSLASWDKTERDRLLNCVLRSPVLIRAARFAVLGTEDLRDISDESIAGGHR
ncbi:hypothetical protein Mth01_38130 [Sphaerimonospora thailandensis]|uniref:Uncharacterized protein n=1 Tax=Sphaerimonospora thailandensis TaxID=795644 RepID=A0A8J3RB08_9ACTN|nr:hypothetical protein Mth01_38130 [Sphaerimonospora thailandensis]